MADNQSNAVCAAAWCAPQERVEVLRQVQQEVARLQGAKREQDELYMAQIMLALSWSQQQPPQPPKKVVRRPPAPAAAPAVLPSFKCPITKAIMRNPVALAAMPPGSRRSYERAAIEEWLSRNSTDPATSEPSGGCSGSEVGGPGLAGAGQRVGLGPMATRATAG